MLLRQLFEAIGRTGQGNTAVVGWGRGMGHKGHMMLASSVITHAEELGGDPYFVVSRTYGPDDPLQPEEKLAIYRKVFPEKGHIFQTATDELPDLTRVLSDLNQQGYTDAVVVVGADQKTAFQYLNTYNGKPDKKGKIPFNFDSLNVISRQETNDPSREEEGPRATPMRAVLTDPTKSDEEQFTVWRDAMPDNLSDEEVMDLMQKAKQRMATMPTAKGRKKVAELSSEKLGQYKKAAGAQASAADKAGDTKKADKRFSGIVKATKKQFANDEKGVAEGSSESVSFREMINVVDEHYPKYYAELSGSDISDEQFKQEIISTYNEITNKQGVAEGWPMGLAKGSAKPETIAKRAAWQKAPLTSNKIVIDGYTINFTQDALIISRGGKVLWKKEGDYSQPTNSTLAGAKKLVTGLSRQGQPDEKQLFGKVNADELTSRKEHRKKWQQASNLSHEKKISFQQAWSQLFGDDEKGVAEELSKTSTNTRYG